MGLLTWLKSLLGGQTSVQVGKVNQSAQTGDHSTVQQSSVGDVSGGSTVTLGTPPARERDADEA